MPNDEWGEVDVVPLRLLADHLRRLRLEIAFSVTDLEVRAKLLAYLEPLQALVQQARQPQGH